MPEGMAGAVSELPVRLCCGQRHAGPVCPDGKVMCTLCFERVEQDGLYVDNDGVRWDVCKECGMVEERNRMSSLAYRGLTANQNCSCYHLCQC